jgi:hypothetical protein
MKKIFFIVSVIVLSFSTYAQSDNDYLEMTREVLKVEKKAAIAEVMQLTDDESQPFWNLYNEYQGKLYLVQNKRIAIIKNFSDNFENISDEKADQLLTSMIGYQQELLKLKKAYYAKFKKIIPAGKAAKFFQAENKIETMVDAQLAIEIPLLEVE